MSENELKPTLAGSGKRIKAIDTVRGFALFGVLLVNVFVFQVSLNSIAAGISPLTASLEIYPVVDKIIASAIHLLAEGKFYTIFSFLFGLGFSIFISRAEEKGYDSRSLFKRRMFSLFCFGLLNFIFIWWGDILHVYALGGLLLLFFRNKKIKSLLQWAIGLFAFSTLISLFMASSPLMIKSLELSELQGVMESTGTIYQKGSFLELLGLRVGIESFLILGHLLFILPKTLGMFLLGITAGRLKIFSDPEKKGVIDGIWKFAGVMGLLSLVIKLFSGYPVLGEGNFFQNPFIYTLFFELGTIFLSLFYISSVLKLLRRPFWEKILSPLQWVGRMALTNYLLQCLICSFVFYGYGLGYMGEMRSSSLLLFTLFLFALQIFFSSLWFKNYQMGPLEWLWRCYTYGKDSVAIRTQKES